MPEDWIELRSEPLDAGAAVSFVTGPDTGGIAVFLGTTRRGKEPPQVNRWRAGLRCLCGDGTETNERSRGPSWREKWPIEKLAILHRTGRVNVGEPSVVIAVSTGHRAEAFEACRWIIDTLKAEAAIWKKEVWGDGSVSWVHWQQIARKVTIPAC